MTTKDEEQLCKEDMLCCLDLLLVAYREYWRRHPDKTVYEFMAAAKRDWQVKFLYAFVEMYWPLDEKSRMEIWKRVEERQAEQRRIWAEEEKKSKEKL